MSADLPAEDAKASRAPEQEEKEAIASMPQGRLVNPASNDGNVSGTERTTRPLIPSQLPGQTARSGSLDLDDIFSPTGGKHRKKVGEAVGLNQSNASGSLDASSNYSNSLNMHSMPPAYPTASQVHTTRQPPETRGIRRYHSASSSPHAYSSSHSHQRSYRLGSKPDKSTDGIMKKVKKREENLPTFFRRGSGSGKGNNDSGGSAANNHPPNAKTNTKKSKPSRAKSGGLLDLLRSSKPNHGRYVEPSTPPTKA